MDADHEHSNYGMVRVRFVGQGQVCNTEPSILGLWMSVEGAVSEGKANFKFVIIVFIGLR